MLNSHVWVNVAPKRFLNVGALTSAEREEKVFRLSVFSPSALLRRIMLYKQVHHAISQRDQEGGKKEEKNSVHTVEKNLSL